MDSSPWAAYHDAMTGRASAHTSPTSGSGHPDPGASLETPPAAVKDESAAPDRPPRPTRAQRAWLARGLDQPGGKLPLFDHNGRRVSARTVRACLDNGWAEPWFSNPVKPDWQICKLTEAGRAVLGAEDGPSH